jgi:MFS family permease
MAGKMCRRSKIATEQDDMAVRQNIPLRRVSIAQFASMAATYAIYFASIALVEERTQSSAQMGWMIFTLILPGFLFGLLAGVYVDRYPRKQVLLLSSLLSLFISAGFAAATFWLEDLWAILIFVYSSDFLLSVLLQFSASARDAFIPAAVKPKQLLAANSILQVVMLGAQGVGAALLCPLLLHIGGAGAIGLAAIPLFALSAWQYAQLPERGQIEGRDIRSRKLASIWSDLRIGWDTISSDAILRRAIGCMVFISTLILIFTTLLPGLSSRAWGVPMAFLGVPGGLGFGLGVLLVGRRGQWARTRQWISIGLLTLGGGLALLATLRTLQGVFLILYLLVSICAGVGFALVVIPARTLIQEHSPDSVRGRVISTQLFLNSVASTMPLPLMGGLADAVGFRQVFALLAIGVLGYGLVYMWHVRG